MIFSPVTGYSVTVKNSGIILGLSAAGTFCIFFLLGIAVGICLMKTASCNYKTESKVIVTELNDNPAYEMVTFAQHP